MSYTEELQDALFALTWRSPGDRLFYWSVHHGWTQNPKQAWLLYGWEVENIESDDRLQSKLPNHKERKEGANWEPIDTEFSTYAESVS